MKRHLPLAALVVLVFAAFCVAQDASPSPSPAAKPKPRMSKAALMKKLSANENALWNAWKNKDAKPFNMWLAADGVRGKKRRSKGDIASPLACVEVEMQRRELLVQAARSRSTCSMQ